MYWHKIFLVDVFIFILSYTATSCTTPSDQVDILMQLYNFTNGRYWDIGNGNPWGIGDPCQGSKGPWYGIDCQQCDVIQIDLMQANLTGPLPPSLGNITTINRLKLQGNNLIGEIWPSIARMPRLDFLTLHDNLFSGTIPFQVNPNYSEFNISNNHFKCPLPTWCSAPPAGNGLCAPCDGGYYCCFYSDGNCSDISLSMCQSSCPSVSGKQLCGQVVANDCSKCRTINVKIVD